MDYYLRSQFYDEHEGKREHSFAFFVYNRM